MSFDISFFVQFSEISRKLKLEKNKLARFVFKSKFIVQFKVFHSKTNRLILRLEMSVFSPTVCVNVIASLFIQM